MPRALESSLRDLPAAAARLLTDAIVEIAPKVLFFFGAFMLIGVMFKLFAAQYSIEFEAFTKAAVAALILGKVIPLLDWVQSGYRFSGHRRIVVIIGKTFVYAVVVIVLGIGERTLKAVRREGSFTAGMNFVIANANMHRFLGLVLLISSVVAAYLTLQEIDRAMGEGALFRLLFQRPLHNKYNDQ